VNTLAHLPPKGVVIQVTFTTRGDPGQDFRYGDVVSLPLDVTSARRIAERPIQYRLRTGVGGYNLDARVFYGSRPTRGMLREAQHQLARLVVASERVTLLARPTRVDWRTPVLLYGAVDNGRDGELVTIQGRDCGQRYFTGVSSATTLSGGSWNTELSPRITTQVRAVWKDAASAPVTIHFIPELVLVQESGRRFEVAVGSTGQLWRKKILIQRRASGKWIPLRQVLLTETASMPGHPDVYHYAEFRLAVPRGSLVRAVLPAAQARPCYLATTSKTLRTT
jgi:hypothetical protein